VPAYFLAEFVILVAPLLLSMTSFAEAPGALSLLLLAPMLVLLLLPPIERGTPLPAKSQDELASSDGRSRAETSPKHLSQSLRPLPALTTYRAHMMLMTILSILAVDFPIFPRTLAKCETYGVSLVRSEETIVLQLFTQLDSTDGPRRWLVRLLARRGVCDSHYQRHILPPGPHCSQTAVRLP
jgi:hypothetical protein